MDKVSLIDKVLSGCASPDEAMNLNSWIALDRDNKKEFEHLALLRTHTNMRRRSAHDSNFDEGLMKIRQVAELRIHEYRERKREPDRNRYFPFDKS